MSLVRAGWLLRVSPEVATVEPAVLDAALATAIARGRGAWPQLMVDDEALVLAIARGIREASEPMLAIAELALEDLYLAQACASGARRARRVRGDVRTDADREPAPDGPRRPTPSTS